MIPGSQNAVALEFRRKLSSLPWQPAPHSDNLSPCDYVRFWRWAPSASANLPSIKRAGSPHYTVIRLKTSFCSATYRPKAHRPIYRDLGALVHSKYLYPYVRHIALIVGTLVALVILRVHGRTTKRSTRVTA